MTTDNLFYLQNRLIQTSQTGGQQYGDTYPLIFSGLTVCLFVSPSLCMLVCLSTHPSHRSIHLYVLLPVCLSVCSPVQMSACLSVCPSVCQLVFFPLSICLPVFLSAHLSVWFYVCPSVCLSVRPSVYPQVRLQSTRMKHLALHSNIRLGRKGLAGTNSLAYYEKA